MKSFIILNFKSQCLYLLKCFKIWSRPFCVHLKDEAGPSFFFLVTSNFCVHLFVTEILSIHLGLILELFHLKCTQNVT